MSRAQRVEELLEQLRAAAATFREPGPRNGAVQAVVLDRIRGDVRAGSGFSDLQARQRVVAVLAALDRWYAETDHDTTGRDDVNTVPTPEQAAELRSLFDRHPVIDAAEQDLRAAGVDHVRDALARLPEWAHHEALTERERAAVLARFTPPPASRCRRCGGAIVYVAHGSDPGWWRHIDIGDLAAPCPCVPDYPDAPDEAVAG